MIDADLLTIVQKHYPDTVSLRHRGWQWTFERLNSPTIRLVVIQRQSQIAKDTGDLLFFQKGTENRTLIDSHYMTVYRTLTVVDYVVSQDRILKTRINPSILRSK